MSTEKRAWASENGTPLNGGKPMDTNQAAFFIRLGNRSTDLDVLDDGHTLVWHINGRTITYVSTPVTDTKAA